MKILELITWFEGWANPILQANWDNSGWQIEPGCLSEKAKVLVCLTPTMAVIQEAIALRQSGIPINLIFAHHPLIFGQLKSLQMGNSIADITKLAFIHQIGIYSAHTNFDQVNHGTADVLAQVLGLKLVKPMLPTQDGVGYGRVGIIEPAPTLDELLSRIKLQLSVAKLLVSLNIDKNQIIHKLAVLGGSGGGYIKEAAAVGANAYLTADCKFHQFQEARDRNLILIDAGHYATERPACERLVEKFRTLGVEWVELSKQDEDFRQYF